MGKWGIVMKNLKYHLNYVVTFVCPNLECRSSLSPQHSKQRSYNVVIFTTLWMLMKNVSAQRSEFFTTL